MGKKHSISQGHGSEARTTSFAYNNDGHLAGIQDAENREFGFEYDLSGRVIKETLPDSRTVEYTYDADGNVASIIPPGKSAHAFAYTPVDLEESYSPPSLRAGNFTTQNGYNLDKQLLEVNRPDGVSAGTSNYATCGHFKLVHPSVVKYTLLRSV